MARTKDTPMTPADMPEILPAKTAELIALQNAAPSKDQMDAVLAAGIDLGRIEALDFVATVANSAILPIYENVKKSKAWQFLRNPESCDGSNFESLNEFCEVKLGKSYRRLQDMAQNRNLIGHEAYDQAEKMGLRQVDYNAIKTLPAPDQELIRQAVGTQSRDEVLGLLQELAGRHALVATELTKDLTDAKAELAATEKLMANKNAQLDKLSRHIAKSTPDDVLAELQKESTALMNDALGCVRGQIRNAFTAIKNHSEADHSIFMAGLVGQLQADLLALREEFNLPDVSTARDQELAAEVSQWAFPKDSDATA